MCVVFCIVWFIFSCIADLSKLVLILFECFAFIISCFFMECEKRLAYIFYTLGPLGALHQEQQNQFDWRF